MITVKEAVKAAMAFVADMFSSENPQGLRLEEVDLSEDESAWHVTVSFVRGGALGAIATSLGFSSAGREYKTVTLRASDGKVQSVKIRQLA
jgi:hypothetical protein